MIPILKCLRKTDDEFIASLAKAIVFWDRCRFLVLLVFATLMLGFFMLLCVFVKFVFDPNNPMVGKQNQMTWIIGFLIGCAIGLILHGVVGYVTSAAIGGYRAERMLLQMHAELNNRRESVRQRIG